MMKIPTCNTCKKKLTPLTGVGWIHPPTPTNECLENDGMIIQSKYRELYNERYGIPKYSFENILSKLEQYKKENNLLKGQVKKWKNQNQQLKEKLQKKKLLTKLKKLWNGITNYVARLRNKYKTS